MKVLNVGGGNKQIAIPKYFDGWTHDLLDIDPESGADLICDAAKLKYMSRVFDIYDAVYCSHNLEHYYRHDVSAVLTGFNAVLKDDGFAHIIVPNMQHIFNNLAGGADIEDIAYTSPAGPIKYIDMIYGFGAMIEKSGNDFMCHKNGFTAKSLGNILLTHGFSHVFVGEQNINLFAFAFKQKPTDQQMIDLKLANKGNSNEQSTNNLE
jgi:hypothetical protein